MNIIKLILAIAFLILVLCLPSRGQTSVNKYDTIKVIMLCADTSTNTEIGRGMTLDSNFIINPYRRIRLYSNAMFWQFGYQVRERIDYNQSYYNGVKFINGNEYSLWKEAFCLDEDKKLLSKSIIIFQTQPI